MKGFYATGTFSQASADISAEPLHIDHTELVTRSIPTTGSAGVIFRYWF
jgi:hypothetical protein